MRTPPPPAQLDRRWTLLNALLKLHQAHVSVGSDRLGAAVLDAALAVADARAGAYLTCRDEEGVLLVEAVRGGRSTRAPSKTELADGRSPLVEATRSNRPQFVQLRSGSEPRELAPAAGEPAKPGFYLPLFDRRADLVGVLVLTELAGSDVELSATLLAELATDAGPLLRRARLHELATFDQLTSLRTRRYFDAWLATEFAVARRRGRELCIALADVDRLQSVLKLHGPIVADVVLQEIARSIRAHVPSGGLAARFGGDEFVIALPETDSGTAESQLLQLLHAVSGIRIGSGSSRGVTTSLSIGVASLVGSRPPDRVTLLKQALTALMRAKGEGRNCVMTHTPEMDDDDSNPVEGLS